MGAASPCSRMPSSISGTSALAPKPRHESQAAISPSPWIIWDDVGERASAPCLINQSAFITWICQSIVAEPGEPPPLVSVPLMNQINTCPVVVLRQRMSLIPSPLKSPVPTITQSVVTLPGTPLPITLATSISQISTSPLLVLYQRMSVLPSPLKSPVPATVQGLPGVKREPPPITLVPLVSQTMICGPALALY